MMGKSFGKPSPPSQAPPGPFARRARPRPRTHVPTFSRKAPCSGPSGALATIPPEKTLVVFDFDCTLSAVHLFHTLRSPEGQQEYSADPRAFFSRIWGGPARIEAVQRFLRTLKAQRFMVYILSFGNEREIVAALKFANVLEEVNAIYGNASYAKAGVTSIQTAKIQMLDMFREKTQCQRMFFSDDDRNNFPDPESGKFECFGMSVGIPTRSANYCGSSGRVDSGFGLGGDAQPPPAAAAAADGGTADTSEAAPAATGGGCVNPAGKLHQQATGAVDEVEVIVFPAGACNGGDGLSIEDYAEILKYLGVGGGLVYQ